MHNESQFPDLSTMLTPRNVWETYNLPPSTVYAWIKSGALPAIRLGRNRLYINPDDVWQLIQPVHESA
jgi:excisionase family DNA binding protein